MGKEKFRPHHVQENRVKGNVAALRESGKKGAQVANEKKQLAKIEAQKRQEEEREVERERDVILDELRRKRESAVPPVRDVMNDDGDIIINPDYEEWVAENNT